MWGWLVRRPAVGRRFRDDARERCRWTAGAPGFGDGGKEEDAHSRQLSLPAYSGLAMTREVWRLVCSGVGLGMMCGQPYRLAPSQCHLWRRHKNGRHRLFRCRPHGRALFCLRTLLNEGGVNRGYGGRAVEVDAVSAIFLADGQLAGQALAAARPQLGRGGEHHV